MILRSLPILRSRIPVLLASALLFFPSLHADPGPDCLPGELSAERILNGESPFPQTPNTKVGEYWNGFAKDRLSQPPKPGIHPRILMSPSDLPDLRRRLKETDSGRVMMETLRARVDEALRKPGEWGTLFYDALATGDKIKAEQLLKEKKGTPQAIGHYQPWIHAVALESFDAMVSQDSERGKKVGAVLAGYADLVEPAVRKAFEQPLRDDVWRAKIAGPTTGAWGSDQGARELLGYHNIGYAYDFAYNFMTDAQRDRVRSVISLATKGKLWMGARLPHHFRNWNWIAVGLGQPLLALAIEGEEGYDQRVYRLGVEIARDYLTYGISPSGCSTEAVGYTQFGFVWGNPFIVAASRRGENLLVHAQFHAMLDWYLHSMDPAGQKWTSHGDGGVSGPSVGTMMMWKFFYPDDPKVDFLWWNTLRASGKDQLKEKTHFIEALIFATDGAMAVGKPFDYQHGATLKAPLTWFDPVRSSLIARSAWSPDASLVQFECRTDSVGASHEHADRGAFTFAALGRTWAKDNFRSVETKYHNSILIDGLGQGYWPGPGKWLGLTDGPHLLVAACDAKEAYDWWWPKQLLFEDPQSFVRFQFPRWEGYRSEAETLRKHHGNGPFERDPRPSVVAHWKGFEPTDPRMWDEDGWPIRLPHNPVQRAFRTLAFSKGCQPWLLVVDDIQKDDSEHLYEWLMQTDMNTDVAKIEGNDIILCDATVKRDENGLAQPAPGDRLLLVRVLDIGRPAKWHDTQARPAFRLETLERRDTLLPDVMPDGSPSTNRAWGLDKRLVVPSRSVAPDFKILIFPHRAGGELPVTTWNADRSRLIVECGGERQELRFARTAEGKTEVFLEAGPRNPHR